MQFVWAGDRKKKNATLIFTFSAMKNAATLRVAAVDCFRVFLDGKFVAYGPSRTAAGYAFVREIPLNGAKEVKIFVCAYNVSCYACDMQEPFFGAEVIDREGKMIAGTKDFSCFFDRTRRENVPRYSYQRAFMEVYDLSRADEPAATYEVCSPKISGVDTDTADYRRVLPTAENKGVFRGFSYGFADQPFWWEKAAGYERAAGCFDVENDFLKKAIGYREENYVFSRAYSGFLGLKIRAEEDVEIFACFEEALADGKWLYKRTNCNDIVRWAVKKGEYEVYAAEPYIFKHLKVLCSGKATIEPFAVLLENAGKVGLSVSGNEKICRVIEASIASFRQNAVDLFTDCPGRERAGWLGDSLFTAQAERLFFGNNAVEKRTLENFVLAKTPELPDGMIPQCFPAEQTGGSYIPTWGMWFVVEICDYVRRTGDTAFAAEAKPKVDAFLKWCRKYENEYGLLEDVDGYVFIDWSISNDLEYTKGVSFPANMLYAATLDAIASLYGEKVLKKQAEEIRGKITELSFDGEFFADNAVRVDGKLVRCDDHVSESCQYYALTFGLTDDSAYKRKMIEEFGPFRKEAYPHIGKSNVFPGNFLRFFYLLKAGEGDRMIEESLEYFDRMARVTGTLWEKDDLESFGGTSACHGFTSVVTVLLITALTGYETVKDGKVIFGEKKTKKNYGVTVRFAYGGEETLVEGC